MLNIDRPTTFLLFTLLSHLIITTAQERPNIVLVLCDDMGFSDIGCYGGEIKTPNLDRFAREGMRFTQFYNNAKCTTTRASILTGLYPRFGKPGHLRQNMLTLGEAMKLAGYNTSLSGKWHLLQARPKQSERGSWHRDFTRHTHPYFRGFDRYYGLLDGGSNHFNPLQPDPPYKGGRIRNFGLDDAPVIQFPENYYTTDAFTDHAVESIHRFSKKEQPFLIHLCYTAPHYPLHAKPSDIAKYRGRYLDGWNALRESRWQRLKDLGLTTQAWTKTANDSRAYKWSEADPEFEDHRMAVYAAMVDSMDQNIGRIRSALEETGEADNTLFLFLSDNGGCAEEPGGRNPEERNPGPRDDYVAVGPSWGWAQNTPFRRYKSWLHEGGITTPFIAWWPNRIPANSINRQAAHIIDLMPTFLQLAKTPYPSSYKETPLLPLEGRSLLRHFKGKRVSPPAELAWYWSGNRAIRHGDWKLVWDKLVKQWELYDLSKDRCEAHNLVDQYPARAAQMKRAYQRWATDVGLTLPN